VSHLPLVVQRHLTRLQSRLLVTYLPRPVRSRLSPNLVGHTIVRCNLIITLLGRMSAISNVDDVQRKFTISVHDVIEAVQKLKNGKAAGGLDGIHM